MPFAIEQIHGLALNHLGLHGRIRKLPGEIDLNFQLTLHSGQKFVLKIANPATERAQLEMQNAIMQHLGAQDLGLEIPFVVVSLDGQRITEIGAPDGSRRFLRLLTWIEGRCFADVNPHTPALLENVGEMCGKLALGLADFEHPAAHRFLKWDCAQAAWTREHLPKIADADKRGLAEYFLQLFENQAVPAFPHLRQSICYNDANDYNILVSHDLLAPQVPGVIDFGDAVYTHTINELAIAAAYCAMHKPDPLTAIAHLVAGFHRRFPLTEKEVEVLFALIGARLLISVTCSAMNRADEPENEYLQISDRPAWALLERLRAVPPALAHYTFRHACGWEPCPQNAVFQAWAKANFQTISQLVPGFPTDSSPSHPSHPLTHLTVSPIWLDLSVGSPDLGTWADIEDADKLHRRIAEAIETGGTLETQDSKPTPAIGRYDEIRPFYTSDAYAVEGNDGPQWRTAHIGLDVFLPPGTPVFAPLDGTVHSFQNNAADRDYGPTIILEHRVSGELTFYTLYGHLTEGSLDGLFVGKEFKNGEKLCEIGPMPINGNWSPHLHFQVMLDALGMAGDFPGVAFPEKRAIWTSLCPDPMLLLTGQFSSQPAAMPAAEILGFRREHLGKNLSVSYQKPLKIERGWRQYLFDDTGRRYLDTVNNVAHVGHEHPRVVRAGQRQMAVLNTNTRYLHENIVHFAEELLATFPPKMQAAGLVAFFVNSGSEANELALRLAKNYTGQRDFLAVEHGYHGNTNACVEVSSYKFDGPGGKGAPPHTHVVPMPDIFRGIFRADDPAAGLKYAAELGNKISEIRAAGRGVAGFICESVISCGGQVTLPPGYLAEAFRLVRAAGGLCIADEVQTGCGRHGHHFWAFEEHGAQPDIVTIGKPIGNGHPLGAVVTTRAVAEAFANGMEYFNTFGGNPVSCAIGREVLRVIHDEDLQQNALAVGQYLSGQLRELAGQFPVIGDVRGPGLFLGFELVKDPETLAPAAEQATYLANRMRELGVLMSTDGPLHNVLKIKPPIVFSRRDADFLTDTLARVLREDFMQVG